MNKFENKFTVNMGEKKLIMNSNCTCALLLLLLFSFVRFNGKFSFKYLPKLQISKNATLGRHLTATRPINRGEVIYTDTPLLLGPKIASTAVCLGCHRSLAPQLLHRSTQDAPQVGFVP